MNGDEILSLFAFTALWIQPVIWALLKQVQSRKLDVLLLLGVIVGLGTYFPLLIIGVLTQYPPLRLYYFYVALGWIISLAFLSLYGWRYTQALSVSALIIFVSSSLWELPLLVLNATKTGPEADWILHLMVVFYIVWIHEWPGWDPSRVGGIISAIFISCVVIIVFPITPPGSHAQWNSLPYLITRSYSAYIVYTMINKEPIYLDHN